MNSFNSNQPKPKAKQPQNDSLVEHLRNLSQGMGKAIKDDLVGGVANDALSSLFGTPKSGNLQPNQPVQLGQQPQPKQDQTPDRSPFPFPPSERFPFPFRRREQFKPQFSAETINRLKQQEAQVAHKIEEIRIELKQLIAEIKSVDKEIQQAIESPMVDPNEYHVNFLDRLKNVLKVMLTEIRQSRNWLTTQKSKKKRMGYWSQYKKKGTTFGLSHERTVATQVG